MSKYMKILKDLLNNIVITTVAQYYKNKTYINIEINSDYSLVATELGTMDVFEC